MHLYKSELLRIASLRWWGNFSGNGLCTLFKLLKCWHFTCSTRVIAITAVNMTITPESYSLIYWTSNFPGLSRWLVHMTRMVSLESIPESTEHDTGDTMDSRPVHSRAHALSPSYTHNQSKHIVNLLSIIVVLLNNILIIITYLMKRSTLTFSLSAKYLVFLNNLWPVADINV